MVLKTIFWEFLFLARAARKLRYNCGTLRKHFTKPLTQVAARPSFQRLFCWGTTYRVWAFNSAWAVSEERGQWQCRLVSLVVYSKIFVFGEKRFRRKCENPIKYSQYSSSSHAKDLCRMLMSNFAILRYWLCPWRPIGRRDWSRTNSSAFWASSAPEWDHILFNHI